MKKCPFLEEVIVRYCTACAIRKMIPGTDQETICTGEKHIDCETFREFAMGETHIKEENMEGKETKFEEYPVLKGNSTFFPPYWAKICKHENCPVCIYRGLCFGAETKWMREPVQVKGFTILRYLYFYQTHTWLKTGKESARIGVDDFAQRLLGKIQGVDLFSKEKIKQGETALKIRSNMGEVQILSPVDGVVKKVNDKLSDEASLINSDPYSKGWIIEIEPSNLDENLKKLIKGENARDWMVTEIDRLSQRMEEDLGVTVADGGTLVNTIENIDKVVWENLVKDFFTINN